jgi:aspartate/methionine/tyrosine aminotransferase
LAIDEMRLAGMVSERAKKVKSFMVMDVMARSEELEMAGEDVVHLEVGEPDFDTPEVVQRAAIEAMRGGKTHYTHALGMLDLREAICEHYQNEYNVQVTPDRVLVTCGTSPGMLLLMLALIEPGDEIILSNPRYACYQNFVTAASGVVVDVQTYPEDGFQFRPEAIKAALSKKTRAIMINSPSNPTGIVMDEQKLEEIASFDDQYIISDEIYHGLVYGKKARSILEFTENAFVINGFSKLYAMTGWRLGYLIFPKAFASCLEKMHQSFIISASHFAQIAAVTALREAQTDVREMVSTYDKRRRFMIDRLSALGLKIHVEPTGAFYVFADARSFCTDSYKEAFNILEQAKVGVTPGIDFGSGGEGFLRFSYANSLGEIEKGMDRLEQYLKTRRG